jgi:zinc D-Ala-D-Ala carboxypeptidase
VPVTHRQPPRRTARIRAASLLVVFAGLAAAFGAHSPASSPPAASSPSRAAPHIDRRGSERSGPLGEAGGAVPDGTTVFDEDVPGVANLDPILLAALRRAATDAAAGGVELVVNSGWRSPAYEDRLRREAVAQYGSEAEAARWVATGTTSPHVSGDAVDIGPSAAAAWLSAHGAEYGLCRIYGNEPWHFQLRPQAVDHGCPPMYADPTHDPRMQQR